MCKVIKKLLEWFAMLNLTIYSILTLSYVIAHTFLISAVLYYAHGSIVDILSFILGIIVSSVFYIQVLACLTATDRMVSISDNIVKVFKCVPFYTWVRGLKRKHRVYLIFGHMFQIQYSMLFKELHKDKSN